MLAYLLSSREREFWRWLGRVTLWSAAALLACYLVSLATGGYLASYLNAEVSALFSNGIYRGLLFWLTRWLVAVCALLSAFELARRLSRAQAEARALAVKDRVMAENYRSLLEKHHDTAVMRHEWKNQLSALRLLAEGGDSAALEARLDELAGMLDRLDPQQYTEHRAINAILQNAAARRGTGRGIPLQRPGARRAAHRRGRPLHAAHKHARQRRGGRRARARAAPAGGQLPHQIPPGPPGRLLREQLPGPAAR